MIDLGQGLRDICEAGGVALICELNDAGSVLVTWDRKNTITIWQPAIPFGPSDCWKEEKSVRIDGRYPGGMTFKEADHHARVELNRYVKNISFVPNMSNNKEDI